MIYGDALKGIIDGLELKRQELDKEIKDLPEGELYIMYRKQGEYYGERLPKRGNRKKEYRKGITKDKKKVAALVRKRYVVAAKEAVDHDLVILKAALKEYIPVDENSIMADFIYRHPRLADGIYCNTSGDDELWADNYERQKDFYEEDRTSAASDGTLMRSRGEILIAEKLRQYKIPYRYEASIGIPELSYVPDFTIRRPRDGKIFYWEHFGDVTDEEYMGRNARKLETYERYGIVPWDNLIITYDFANGGVNTPLIDAMIHAWLL